MPIPDVPVRGRPGSSSRPKLPPTAVGTTPLHSPHVTARPVAPVASLHVLSRPSASHHALSLHRSCLVPLPHVLSRPLTSLHVTTRNVRSPSRPFAPLHVPPRPLHFTSLHFAPLHVGPTLLSYLPSASPRPSSPPLAGLPRASPACVVRRRARRHEKGGGGRRDQAGRRRPFPRPRRLELAELARARWDARARAATAMPGGLEPRAALMYSDGTWDGGWVVLSAACELPSRSLVVCSSPMFCPADFFLSG